MRIPTLPHDSRRHAFTRIEVLVILIAVGILAGLVLPRMNRPIPKQPAPRIQCANNLKMISIAAWNFAADNMGEFPWQIPIEDGESMGKIGDNTRIWRHFLILSNELTTPKTLTCPKDPRILPNIADRLTFSVIAGSNEVSFSHNDHVSYFLNARTSGQYLWKVPGGKASNPEPQTILGGDRNLTRNGTPITGQIRPGTNDAFAFTSPGHHQGDGNLLLGDGSVIQVSQTHAAAAFSEGFAAHGTNPPALLLIP